MRILVVDDLEFMRNIICDILVNSGFEIAGEAIDGLDCLSRYRKTKPDLVLLDIAMPRMDGISALKHLKRMDSASTVVMCSSLGDQENIIRSIQWGASDFVVKPFQRERLVSAIQKLDGRL